MIRTLPLSKLFGLLLGLTPIWFLVNPSLVISVTTLPEDIPLASDSQTITEELKQRIQNVVQEKLKTSQEALENKTINRLVGYVGKITDLKQGSFTLNTRSETLPVTYTDDTAIVKEAKTIKAELLSLNDRVIVIGRFDTGKILTAKRIIVTPEPNLLAKRLIKGSISKINKANKSLRLIVSGKELILVAGKKLILDFDKIKVGDQIIGIILETDDLTTLLKAKIL